MITALLVGGIVVFTGLGFYVSYLQSNDIDTIKAGIKNAEENIQRFQTLIDKYYALLDSIDETLRHLGDGKKYFSDGGYSYSNEPLAKAEFLNCINDLSTARTNTSKILFELEANVKDLSDEKAKLQAHLDEVIKKINDELRKEGKIQ